VALIVIGIVALVDVRGAIGFSSFGVLLYYLVANIAAFRQQPGVRRYPRVLQVIGGIGCAILAFTLPWQSVVAGVVVVLVGIAYRAVRLRLTRAA
jgi:APA family basic amino acid/polyamine antiporter